ncbi:MAG: nitroreductase/quinone reductase family protein [Chloroflexota bacterium]
MMSPLLKAIAKIHTAVMRISGGRMGNQMGGNEILLLHHVGAKSNKNYVSPLAYVEDEGAYAIIAAAAGQAKNPGWFHNLKKNPSTIIEIKGKTINVTAKVAPKETRDRIWADVVVDFPQFASYEEKTTRVIPIVLLHPQS